jgi:hypothetical protein
LTSLVLDALVLCTIELLLLLLVRVASGSGAGSNAGDLRRVAAFSLYRLLDGFLEVDDQIFVDGIFIRRLTLGHRLDSLVHTAGLGPPLRWNSLMVLVRVVDRQLTVSVLLNRLVVQTIVSLAINLNW